MSFVQVAQNKSTFHLVSLASTAWMYAKLIRFLFCILIYVMFICWPTLPPALATGCYFSKVPSQLGFDIPPPEKKNNSWWVYNTDFGEEITMLRPCMSLREEIRQLKFRRHKRRATTASCTCDRMKEASTPICLVSSCLRSRGMLIAPCYQKKEELVQKLSHQNPQVATKARWPRPS